MTISYVLLKSILKGNMLNCIALVDRGVYMLTGPRLKRSKLCGIYNYYLETSRFKGLSRPWIASSLNNILKVRLERPHIAVRKQLMFGVRIPIIE